MNNPIDEVLLWRFFEQTLNKEEKQLVEEWINSSEENKKQARQLAYVYFASNLMDANQNIDASAKLDVFFKKARRREIRVLCAKIGRIAAIFLLPVLLFSIYYWWPESQSAESMDKLVEIRTQSEISAPIVLPDSSIVYLNVRSSLKYPSLFANDRNVYLQGEAFFIVKKHQGARFIVNTQSGAKVEVLGTEFNVSSIEQKVSTTLAKGSVLFICQNQKNKEEKIPITPGQKISYNSDTKNISICDADMDAELGWKDEKTVFDDSSLTEVLDVLSKRFNVDFDVKNEKLKGYTFTGVYKKQSLEQILDNMALSCNLKYKYIKTNTSQNDTTIREKIELY